MVEPDVSALTDQQRATYFTGAIVRNDMLLEATLRTIARDFGRAHPADPVPEEPAEFSSLLELVTSGIHGMDATAPISDLLDAVAAATTAHEQSVALVHALWSGMEDTDVFQMLDLHPRDPNARAHGLGISFADLSALVTDQVRAYVRLGGAEMIVRHHSYTSPFDTDAASTQRLAQVRGEFDIGPDGVVLPRATAAERSDPAAAVSR